ncbi:MAG: acylhydrolase [Calditrichaeota bacterium]|nr:MAG: acylhydrolase [Calditrichota bacterium]MBL1206121.1 acylhydrolase [Calditrichota bacterium]NOG45946.1 acylhydrolase [Calditrichota bacterium]
MKLILLIFIGWFLTSFSQVQDWANLNRFKNENQKLADPTDGENRVVFMGNSITDSWARFDSSFFSGKPYINRGISGQTTPQMLIRFRADVVDLKSAVVVILAGTNDIAGNTGPSTNKMIFDNIKSMAEVATANKIKVVLCSVLPVLDYPWKPGLNPSEKIIKLNKMIKDYSYENGLVYLDYFQSMVNDQNGLKDELTYDGVHPNKAGYKVMAPLAEAAITKALNQN